MMSRRSGSARTRPGSLLLLEPCETHRAPPAPDSGALRTRSRRRIPGRRTGPGQPRNKTSGIGSDHDSELFEQLAGEGIAIRLALLDVTTRASQQFGAHSARRVSVNEQDSRPSSAAGRTRRR